AVRRSAVTTLSAIAATAASPGRSVRWNTTPCPGCAGFSVTVVCFPVCSPTPASEIGRATERLPSAGIGIDQPFQPVHQGRESPQGSDLPKDLAMTPCWIARYRHSGLDIADHAALGRDPGAAADPQVIRQPCLPANNRFVLYFRGSGDTHLGHDQATLADAHVVPHVYQVVDLGSSSDYGIAHTSPVNGAVGPYMDFVPENDLPNVQDMSEPRITGPVPEARPADTSPTPDHYGAAQDRAGGKHGVASDTAVIAQPAS